MSFTTFDTLDSYTASVQTSTSYRSLLFDDESTINPPTSSRFDINIDNPAALYITPEFLRRNSSTLPVDCTQDFTFGNPAIIHSSALETPRIADVSVDYTRDGVVHLLIGSRGGQQIGLNGFQYSHDRRKTLADGTVQRYWQCLKKNDPVMKCTARLITSSGSPPTIIREPEHCHEPNPLSIEVAKVKTKISENAASEEPSGTVVRQAILDSDDIVKANLPTLENLKCTVRRKRRKLNHHPVNPDTAADIVIPSHYQLDHAGRRFLLADKTNSTGKKVLVFSTDTGLDSLQAPGSPLTFIDGTFNVRMLQNLKSTLKPI